MHQQTSDTQTLKDLFRIYYDLKLKKRKKIEDINELNMGNKDYLNNPSFYNSCEEQELLILIYKLFEEVISSMGADFQLIF